MQEYLREPIFINSQIRENIKYSQELAKVPTKKRQFILEKWVKERSKQIKEDISKIINKVFLFVDTKDIHKLP